MPDVMLPYRTDWRSMLTLLDYAKGKGVDRASLEARMGAGESLRETLNAVEQLGLVVRDEAGDVHLTEAGERLAYATSDADRQDELALAMLRYPPYAIPLERAVGEGMAVLDGPWVERVWQVDMRLGQPRNRVEEARTFYFRLADEAGFGTFRRGVRGLPTRLDLDPEIRQRLDALRQRRQAEERAEAAPAAPAPGEARVPESAQPALPPGAALPPSVALSVTVDMTEWDIEKIEAFLRLIGLATGRD